MNTLTRALVASSQGEVRIGQIVDELANQLELSQQDRSDLLPSGKQTVFGNRVPWAKSYLSKAQLVEMTSRRPTYCCVLGCRS